MKKLLIVMVSASCMAFGAAAGADENEQYVVTYAANELGNYDGVRSVHARIVKAAKQFCPTYSQIRSSREVNACIEEVVADLVAKVDHPRLSDYHAGDDRVRVAGSSTALKTSG